MTTIHSLDQISNIDQCVIQVDTLEDWNFVKSFMQNYFSKPGLLDGLDFLKQLKSHSALAILVDDVHQFAWSGLEYVQNNVPYKNYDFYHYQPEPDYTFKLESFF